MPACTARCVVLRHDLPDGSWHFDWLMERGEESGAMLITFRVFVPIWEAGAFEAQRVPDHRRDYLMYEGPVSGNRGRVERAAAGRCRVLVDAPGAFVAEVSFEGQGDWRRYEGSPMNKTVVQASDRWEERRGSQTQTPRTGRSEGLPPMGGGVERSGPDWWRFFSSRCA